MENLNTTARQPLICPSCERSELREFGDGTARCGLCGCVLEGSTLQTLREISHLPDAFGSHACECGHPEMRLLPGGIYRCPACGSEVLPVDTPPVSWKSADHTEAYWDGWIDGRYRDPMRFTRNPRLSRWEDPSDRVEFYRGHRAGREARRRGVRLLEAS
jgi:ribosomal protein L37AE/L43A